MDKSLKLNILYIGPIMSGETCLQRAWAFQDLGHTISWLNTGVPRSKIKLIKFFYKVWRRLFPTIENYRLNRLILKKFNLDKYNLVWIDKGKIISPDILKKIKIIDHHCILISFSPDDMLNPNNQTENYLNSIPIYDAHITTKSYNVKELYNLKANRVIMMDNGFCTHTHYPVLINNIERKKWGGQVGFIGFWEKEREEYITYLAENGIGVRIWGSWSKKRIYHPNITIEDGVAWGKDYAKAICSFDINLSFLRKENRDLQTTRSIEIPACRSFMLAERTAEHLSLFEEGIEAEFFSSKEELLQKVKYYLLNKDEINKIAIAGYNRCINSNYSYTARLDNVINKLF